jgi:Tol biopolymer transport system component
MKLDRCQLIRLSAPAVRASSMAAALILTMLSAGGPAPPQATINVTVSEGTSMAVAVSPDGHTLAVDLQGSIWTLPASGGTAKRITDVFNDAHQPAWSPDGKWIAFFGDRDGTYNIWVVAPDGSNQHKLTWGPFDDREPAWSHDGTRVAFASDRGDPMGSNYNIWVLDLGSHAMRRLTSNPAEDYMPSWSPDDSEIAFVSTRDGARSVWAIEVETGRERQMASSAGRIDALSWGPGGQIVCHSSTQGNSRLEVDGQPFTGSENVFPFRVSWASATQFFYVSDGKIRKRTLGGGDAQTVEFKATLPVTQARYTHRRRALLARFRSRKFWKPVSRTGFSS